MNLRLKMKEILSSLLQMLSSLQKEAAMRGILPHLLKRIKRVGGPISPETIEHLKAITEGKTISQEIIVAVTHVESRQLSSEENLSRREGAEIGKEVILKRNSQEGKKRRERTKWNLKEREMKSIKIKSIRKYQKRNLNLGRQEIQ